ncbi:hypothetical protein ACFWNN_28060 [Lentzea sp. NPDC058450]
MREHAVETWPAIRRKLRFVGVTSRTGTALSEPWLRALRSRLG